MANGHRSKLKRVRNADKDTRPKAHAKYVRVSDTKARIVLEQIKGKDVTTAAAILAYSPRWASRLVEKTLHSAVANAENNAGLDKKDLFVEEAIANQAGMFKRGKSRAKGRFYRIEKKLSHISIILNTK
jgi:large subunit ribosomal protein L22